MGPARFQETLRRLAIFDERLVPAGLAGDPRDMDELGRRAARRELAEHDERTVWQEIDD